MLYLLLAFLFKTSLRTIRKKKVRNQYNQSLTVDAHIGLIVSMFVAIYFTLLDDYVKTIRYILHIILFCGHKF